MRFFMVMDCDKCDEPIRIPMVTLNEHNGTPEIYFDMAAQTRFDCENEDCGAVWYTGDFDYFSEDDI